MDIKNTLFQKCLEFVDSRIEAIQSRLASIEESKNNETKSSAGDKFETGRAMMQAEEAKCKAQLAEVQIVKMTLKNIPTVSDFSSISLGCLVTTSNGIYYLAIGAGKIRVNDKTFYAISNNSPIAQLLLGKKIGEVIHFNTQAIKIEKIE